MPKFFRAASASLLVVLSALLWGINMADWHRNLSVKWVSRKTELEKGVMGAASFALSPMSVRNKLLRPGLWHGFQEVATRDFINADALAFRAFTGNGGALLFFLEDGDGTKFFALRLSTAFDQPSAFLSIAPDGRFLSSEPVEIPMDLLQKAVAVEFRLSKSSVTVDIGGRRFTKNAAVPEKFRFGVRGFRNEDATVSELKLESGGHVDFLPFSQGPGFDVLAGVLSLAVLAGLVFFAFPGKRMLPAAGAGLALSVFFGWINNHYLFARYPLAPQPGLERFPMRIELQDQILPKLAARMAAREGEEKKRPVILLVGGSQLWGAGASRADRAVDANLARDFPDYDIVNAAVSGENTDLFVKIFPQLQGAFEPALSVFVLGTNDAMNPRFGKNLESILALARSRGLKVLLAAEPNMPPLSELVRGRHEALRAAAKKFGFPVLDLQAKLEPENAGGLLWWDFVHLTDYGQKLEARFLADAAQEALSAGGRTSSRAPR